MVHKKDPTKVFTIIVGGDMDLDDEECFVNSEKWSERPRDTLYVRDWKELHDWLSPAKLGLLIDLMNYNPMKEEGVGDIALRTKRKREAISRDIHHLAGMNLVHLKKNGKNVLVSTPFESIQIQFARKK